MSIKISDIEVELIDYMGNDLSVVNAARVSFDKISEFEIDPSSEVCHCSAWHEHECACGNFHPKMRLKEKDAKLINYLAKHGHISPFHHTFITVRVKAPIFVRSQAVKHKFMPVNEVSRRYVSDEPEFYIPEDYRLAAENVKQGSSDETTKRFINPWGGEACHINSVMYQHVDASVMLYQGMLNSGICAEQARMVLPQNMMTTWYWSGTLSAFADMLRLRLDSHAQKEIQYMAQKIRDIIEPLYPVSLKALLENK